MADEQKNLPLFGNKESPPAETDLAESGGARGLRATGDGPLKRLVDNKIIPVAPIVERDFCQFPDPVSCRTRPKKAPDAVHPGPVLTDRKGGQPLWNSG